jgi:CubicO group peptidase (beta-lactamase class C family)
MMMLTRRLVTFAPLLGAALPIAAQAAEWDSFDLFVQKTLHDYSVPGAVIVVVNAKGVVFLKGYGVRRTGSADPVDANTRFQIASMSKFVTATAIAILVDRGVVDWDRPVSNFSPETALVAPYATDNATLRDYLAHRTGLPAYGGDLLTQLGYSPNELVRRARFLAFDHSFREEWAYSNYGIFLGQFSAAHAAGISAPELLSNAIFRPLGMARSAPALAALFEDVNRATPHDIDGSVMEYENVDAFSGAGAVVSTGADIARWMQMLLADGAFEGQQILKQDTITHVFAASMVQGVGGPLRDPNDCAGLGCESYNFLGCRVIEKNGALNGIRTIVTLVPEREIGIAVFANKQLTVFPEAVRAEFLEHTIGPSGRDLQAQIRNEQSAWQSLIATSTPPTDAKPIGHDLDAFTGRFASTLYGSLEVVREAAALAVRIGPRNYPGRLTHWSGDVFLLSFDNPDVAPGLLTFNFENSAEVTRLVGSKIPDVFSADYGRFERIK